MPEIHRIGAKFTSASRSTLVISAPPRGCSPRSPRSEPHRPLPRLAEVDAGHHAHAGLLLALALKGTLVWNRNSILRTIPRSKVVGADRSRRPHSPRVRVGSGVFRGSGDMAHIRGIIIKIASRASSSLASATLIDDPHRKRWQCRNPCRNQDAKALDRHLKSQT